MKDTRVGTGDFVFDFDDQWFDGAHHTGDTDGWAHHGIVVTSGGEVVTFDEKLPRIQVLTRDGVLVRTFDVDVVEGHGMLLVEENGLELLWVSDIGSKMQCGDDGAYSPAGDSPVRGSVVKLRLDGSEVFRLPMPELSVYENGDYCPAQVAVDERRFGGSGDIWVADCYGQMLVHRFDETGAFIATLDGSTGAGRFTHPHAIHIDRRGSQPELLVADRRNKRIQVFDLAGDYLRSFGEDFLVSPSGFAAYGENLLVTELDSRLTVLGPDNEVKAFIGSDRDSERTRPGWPNAVENGQVGRPPLETGKFNTPHGVAVDSDGNLYVSEWLVGGRLDKLTRR